jgi:methyltransferase-like protein 6
MKQAARNVASSLRPGGVLVFRDYGRYDEAQMKLGVSRNKQLKDNFYRKHDGTKCYYFTLEELEDLFKQAGLEVLDLKYLRRVVRNNATGETRRRVWASGRFIKPA